MNTLNEIQQAGHDLSSDPSVKVNQIAELSVDKQISYALEMKEVRKLVG